MAHPVKHYFDASTEHWVDFDFFGNQISAHISHKLIERERNPGKGNLIQDEETSEVDKVQVPLSHFGAILHWNQFHELAERLTKNGIQFIIPPQIRYVGMPGEQATMFFRDPSGNALEFKAFKNEDEIFTPQQIPDQYKKI